MIASRTRPAQAASFAMALAFLCCGAAPTWGAQLDELADRLASGTNRLEHRSALSELVTLGTPAAKDVLVAVIANGHAPDDARDGALAALIEKLPHLVTSSDIESLAATKDFGSDLYLGMITDLAPKIKLDERELRAVCALYPKSKNIQPAILIFCRKIRDAFAKDFPYRDILTRVVGAFLTEAAEGERDGLNLSLMGADLIDFGLPGGPALLIRCIRLQRDAPPAEMGAKPALAAMQELARFTGLESGIAAKFPNDTEIAAAIPRWLGWWAANKTHEGYNLPGSITDQ
jgi:hypothetical protein